ncbi:MAG: glycosyltransferase family 8 protein [Rhodomicrobium sp.]|nr:glycosyltransferase family 8 protein [Rhodomicrobium sp.]
MDRLPIAFGVDAPYLPHLAATIASLAATAPRANFEFIVLHGGLPEGPKAMVEAAAPRARFRWVEIRDDMLHGLDGHWHISRATFYRLMLPEILEPEMKRLIYLDADLIVARDIRQLWATDMENRAIAAVYDAGIDAVPFARRWGLEPIPGSYFNAGVLLIDMERVRGEGVFRRAFEFLLANRPELGFMDQDALNHTLWRQWRLLDPVWNVQRNMILGGMPNYVPDEMRLRGRPAIVHYTTEHKPWLPEVYHPYAWLYWRALARTPFWADLAKAGGVNFGSQVRMGLRFLKRWPFLAPRDSGRLAA